MNLRPSEKDSDGIFFLKTLINRFLDDDVGAHAAECTYYFILGLVPAMIFLVHFVLFFAAPQIQYILRLLTYFPPDVAQVLQNNILRILGARSSVWMAVGLAAALWTSSQSVDTMIRASDKAFWGNRNIQHYFWVKVKSLFFTVFISFAMILSLGLIVFANAVVYAVDYYFDVPPLILQAWTILKFGIPFVIVSFSLAIFYHLAPVRRVMEWKQVVVTSFLVTLIWLGLTYGYGYYMLHISSMGITYGSLVGLVVLFIWLHLTAMVIIAGSEFIMTWKELQEREKKEGTGRRGGRFLRREIFLTENGSLDIIPNRARMAADYDRKIQICFLNFLRGLYYNESIRESKDGKEDPYEKVIALHCSTGSIYRSRSSPCHGTGHSGYGSRLQL